MNYKLRVENRIYEHFILPYKFYINQKTFKIISTTHIDSLSPYKIGRTIEIVYKIFFFFYLICFFNVFYVFSYDTAFLCI